MVSGQPDYAGTVLGPRVVPATNERRTIILNDSGIVSGVAPPSNRSASWYGKFFPRGMRGTIEEIRLYAYRTAAGTVTLNISPQPGLGPTYSTVITPGLAWGWVDAAFNVMWNYDSLYVWIRSCGAAVFWGYDAVKPFDCHLTANMGATFTDVDERPFIRVVMTGETAGDVPVSGTLNVIPLPNRSVEMGFVSNYNLPDGMWTTIMSEEGTGHLVEVIIRFETVVIPTAAVEYGVRFRIDGLGVANVMNRQLTQTVDATSGRCSIGEFLQDGTDTWLWVRLPISYRRMLDIAAWQSTGAVVVTDVWLVTSELV